MPRELMQAACKGANADLFDATEGDEVEDALSYCDRCPVTQTCEDYVQPRRSYFDGVCGGKVWRNGKRHTPGLFDEGAI
jgi:hypothetical protein